MLSIIKTATTTVVLYTCLVIIFNEYIIYYLTILSCDWPQLKVTKSSKSSNLPLRFLVLSDPHLLGERQGHWFDKLRREWQMYRSYQSALQLFKPEVVFVLGDLLDEGQWATSEQWEKYVNNAKKVFATPEDTLFRVVIGNHDVGFHDRITNNHITRFFRTYETEQVKVETIRGNNFIIINSMGLEGDGCGMCDEVETRLQEISKALNCAQGKSADEEQCEGTSNLANSKPIILQHFPLYRDSDASCRGEDAAPEDEINKFIEGIDAVSDAASTQILKLLQPRLIMSGHTHHGCYYRHDDGTPEVSIPSFSWRNRNNPSFTLVTMTTDDFAISKCFLPHEHTVFLIYGVTIVILLYRLSQIWKRKRLKRGVGLICR